MYLLGPDAAAYLTRRGLKISNSTLGRLRSVGGGPTYHRVAANRVLYAEEDLDAWLEQRLGKAVSNTAEERARGQSFNAMDTAREAQQARK